MSGFIFQDADARQGFESWLEENGYDNDEDLLKIAVAVDQKRGVGEKFNNMGNAILDKTSLHVTLNRSVRINSDENDGPVRLGARYAGPEGTHAINVGFAVKEWYAEVYTTPDEAIALLGGIWCAIHDYNEAEAILADPVRLEEWQRQTYKIEG